MPRAPRGAPLGAAPRIARAKTATRFQAPLCRAAGEGLRRGMICGAHAAKIDRALRKRKQTSWTFTRLGGARRAQDFARATVQFVHSLLEPVVALHQADVTAASAELEPGGERSHRRQ